MKVGKLATAKDFNPGKEEPQESGNLNTNILKRFAELEEKKSEIESELRIVKDELGKLDSLVQDQLINSGIKRISVAGRTIFVKERIIAKYNSRAEAIEALKKADLGYLVSENFNTQTLNAYIAELIRNGEPLPKEFEGAIKNESIFKAASCKS